jgi:predicted nucleic acid-binding protein
MTVLDASVAVAALSPDEAETHASAIVRDCMEEGAAVPSNWHLEIVNVLLVKQRRRVIDAGVANQALDAIFGIGPTVDVATDRRTLQRTKQIAERHGLTSYDAAYLELAMRRALPLATLDRRLAEAARSEGVRVLPDGGAR